MAKKSIKLRAKQKGDAIQVKAIITHPMETGTRKDKTTGEIAPRHFIQEVSCKHNGEEIMSMNWGPTVSRNPFLEFSFEGGVSGDAVELSWIDNKGGTGAATAKIR
ncbi:MAG: thiosulfate oxidation carrier complex protein SoxZ [Gammaproteobacteria bacterium]|nr:thiosulfate oxidation carrier complex protein SoxZ [Gammaproteobacteria bacterium]